MKIIVTRPAKESAEWVDRFRARGLQAQAIPLIEIVRVEAPRQAALDRAREKVSAGKFRAVMFVSGNAVDGFLGSSSATVKWPSNTRAWAPGPGTETSLLKAGFDASQIDSSPAEGQFDSESLWRTVERQPLIWEASELAREAAGDLASGSRVLIVRGAALESNENGEGRNWLASKLTARGVEVEYVVSYERRVPGWSAEQRDAIQASLKGDPIWLFSSSEAIGNLTSMRPDSNAHEQAGKIDWSGAKAVVTHPRIAEAARRAGFGVVCQSRPSVDDVVASIESMQ